MSGFLGAEIAHFLLKNLPNRVTISSIFKETLNSFICREIPPDLIRASLVYGGFKKVKEQPHNNG